MTPRPKLKTLLVLFLLFCANTAWTKPSYQVMCYALQNTMAPSNTVNDSGQGTAINWTSDVPWNDITLVLDAFYQPETNDTLTNEGAKGSSLINAAHAQGERCIVSLGGAGQDGAFPTLCSSAANITAFAKAVTALVSNDNYDGVDIDWETPNAASETDATNMMIGLYNAIKALPNSSVDGKPRTLSFTTTNYIECIYNITTLASYTDWCFFMGYDWYENPTYLVNGPLGGMPNDASAPSPCSSSTFTDDDKGWITAMTNGVMWSYPASKMILGCPLYTDDYNAGTEIDTLSILHLGTAGTYNTGYAEQLYTAPDGDQVYVDTAQSYCDKINWMHSAGLMGIGMWDMGQGLPYTDTDMAPIWNTIGGNSACITFGGATSTMTETQTSTPTTAATSTRTSTNTSTVPPNTATSTATRTMTETETNTNTPLPNTATSTQTNTKTPPPNTVTSTSTQTHTITAPVNTFTTTSTETATSTPLAVRATSTSSSTSSMTSTSTLTHTATLGNTATSTGTNTPPANTATSTSSPTSTETMTDTSTHVSTPTSTATATPSNTTTLTPQNTFTRTSTPTVTHTMTLTYTATPALTNCPNVPTWNGNVVVYKVGQEVGYNGELYQCIQAHTSEPNWMPPAVPALWKDMGPCGSTPTSVAGTGVPVIYPNPVTSDNASIQLPSNDMTNVKVQIFTIAFREVQSKIYTQVSGNILALVLADKTGHNLANGLYYVVVEQNGNRWIDRLLVLK